jgi:PAS domain S-box-containing protein
MIQSGTSTSDLPLEASIPASSLETILCTEELRRRPWRPPDHTKENSALVALVSALADSPHTILQTLADKVLEVLHADSAGLSLLTKDEKRFYWAAIAGAWRPHIGGGTPRDFGPCGDVLDHHAPMLFTHWERRYPYLSMAVPLADEGLLVPFYVNGKAVGTIWAIAHNGRRKFDAEDLRLLESMGHFASAAYQTVESIENLKLQMAARERAETALRELANGLEAKVRRLVDSNIIGIFIWNLDGRIIDANDAFLRIVGYGRDDLVSGRLRWRELTPAEYRDADDQRVAELKAIRTAQRYEKEYLHKNGSRVPVLIGSAMFEEGLDEGVAFVLDLTDRKRAELAAREIEQRYSLVQMELAHVTRVTTLGEMSASIAHEINQPLAAIVTNAEATLRLLSHDVPDIQDARAGIADVIKDAHRAGEVIRRIRDFSKKAHPQMMQQLDINEVVEEAVKLVRHEALRHGITIRFEFASGLPPVRGDRIQLQQVIVNLAVNGMEAMTSVQDCARVLIVRTQRDQSDRILVAVADAGVGVEPENLNRVFDAFHTTKPGGLGMGLAICRSIIEAHTGRLWADANVPRGAIFRFTVPAVAASTSEVIQ